MCVSVAKAEKKNLIFEMRQASEIERQRKGESAREQQKEISVENENGRTQYDEREKKRRAECIE